MRQLLSGRQLTHCGVLVLVASLCVVTDARRQHARAAQLPWRVLISIGVESGDPRYELSGISSAVRLTNGEIVVANAGTSELRWFDSTGRFIRSFGRRGVGPQEFGRAMYLFHRGNDTLAVNDGPRRLHLLSSSGRYITQDTLPDESRRAFIHDAVLVLRPQAASPNRIRAILNQLPRVDDAAALVAIPDERGNVWMQNPRLHDQWIAYPSNSRVLGAVTLPADFTPFEFADSVVLGLRRDSNGVERVQLLQVRIDSQVDASLKPVAPRPPYEPLAELAANERAVSLLRAATRNLVTAQEAHRARHNRYGSSTAEIGLSAPERVEVRVVRANTERYLAVASHPATRITCMVFSGPGVPGRTVLDCG